MNRISRDQLFMEAAALWAKRSTCPRAQVGCVLVRDNRVLSAGYNGAPPNMVHCTQDGCELVLINGHESCRRAIHAEANAIAWSARSGTNISGATLYGTHEPCHPCAQLLISAGVVSVRWLHDYHLGAGNLLRKAGVEIIGSVETT
jgi:dCMP deaminase